MQLRGSFADRKLRDGFRSGRTPRYRKVIQMHADGAERNPNTKHQTVNQQPSSHYQSLLGHNPKFGRISFPRDVAVVGAGGKLGPYIVQELLGAGFSVTIITRTGSSSTTSLPSHPNQNIQEVDFSSPSSLEASLRGVQVVISAVGSDAIIAQKPLIDAAVAVGVERFLPSEFGCDTTNHHSAKLAVYRDKVAIQQYLKGKAAAYPNFSYTIFCNNAFFDWGLRVGFLLNLKAHSVNLFDGGNQPFSVTRLSTVGRGVVQVLKNFEATKDRAVYVHDAIVTQNQVMDIVKRIDGKPWNITNVDTEELERLSFAELCKENPNVKKATAGNVYRACFGDGYGGDFSDRLDNGLLGMVTLTDRELSQITEELM